MLGRMIASLVRRVYVFILPVLLGGALASCQHLPAPLKPPAMPEHQKAWT